MGEESSGDRGEDRDERKGQGKAGKGQGNDEMPKSEIEKRKRNMQSIFRILRREKRNVNICFLVREENKIFCKKTRNL